MRSFLRSVLIVSLMLVLATAAAAQESGAVFDDVPPWHWAYEAVQRLGAAGIMIGYPRTDRDRALNALTQIYDAFAHAAHPAARAWAERFLVTFPRTGLNRWRGRRCSASGWRTPASRRSLRALSSLPSPR